MKAKTIITTTILSIVSISITICSNHVSALEYSSSAGVNFTISPSISVSVSGDLIIDELAPGSQSDSNIIVVNVSTNNVNGYNLSSTVGNNIDTSNIDNSLIHNTTNLVNNSSFSDVFTSLSTNDSLSTLTAPNTWGYSYSINDGSTWSNYSGLPLYTNTGITLSEKYLPSNDNIDFKIAAYADNTQSSGEYTNKINFTAIAFPNPMSLAESYAYFNKTMYKGYYTIQDMNPGICATATDLSEMQVIDVRDDNVYTIAKLADHRCWMTTNLDLPGGTELYSDSSNVADGYPESGGVPYYTLPESSTEGFDDDTKAFVYNSGNHTNTCSLPGCYSYYSYVAATGGSGTDLVDPNSDAPFSICSKNWHLPSIHSGNDSSSDFRALFISLGGSSSMSMYDSSTNPTGSEMYKNLISKPNNFVGAGAYSGGSFIGVGGGYYQSSTVVGSQVKRYLYFNAFIVNTSTATFRGGNSVRCIADN